MDETKDTEIEKKICVRCVFRELVLTNQSV